MIAPLLAAVADTLLPGDEACPSASSAGLDLSSLPERHGSVMSLITSAAGGAEAFLAADHAARVEIIRRVERELPTGFRALVADLSATYFGLPAVQEAFGWTARPPQPNGFALATEETAMEALLEPVRRRAAIWRPAD